MKALLIVALFLIAVVVAGFFASRNLNWSTVDGVGVPVTITQEPTPVSAIKTAATPPLYVKCELNGQESIMTAQACQKARDTQGEMAP